MFTEKDLNKLPELAICNVSNSFLDADYETLRYNPSELQEYEEFKGKTEGEISEYLDEKYGVFLCSIPFNGCHDDFGFNSLFDFKPYDTYLKVKALYDQWGSDCLHGLTIYGDTENGDRVEFTADTCDNENDIFQELLDQIS